MKASPDAMARTVEREFFGGSIRLHILHHAGRAPVFGAGLIEELRRHGYRVSPGTLYAILAAVSVLIIACPCALGNAVLMRHVGADATPLVAAAAMSMSSVSVVGTALQLRKA